MQVPINVRATISGVITAKGNPVDVSNAALLNLSLIVHSIGGTSPSLTSTLETSDDLETWASVGTPITLAVVGYARVALDVKTTPIGRFVRVSNALSGTIPVMSYSVYLNTYASS